MYETVEEHVGRTRSKNGDEKIIQTLFGIIGKGGKMPFQYFFYLRIIFFWLLSLRRTNKKI
jgi:hypothetical protein